MDIPEVTALCKGLFYFCLLFRPINDDQIFGCSRAATDFMRPVCDRSLNDVRV